MGSFTLDIGNVLRATKFGVPFTHIPTSFKGYYKYKAGEVFTVKGEPVSGRKDICDIYAVFYETDDKVKSLDGTNVFTSPNLISIARISNAKETEQWTEFNLPLSHYRVKPLIHRNWKMENTMLQSYSLQVSKVTYLKVQPVAHYTLMKLN